jgi:hypothetical protein
MEIFYAYCDNTAVDLDPLPVGCARLAVVELTLSDMCLKWQHQLKVAECPVEIHKQIVAVYGDVMNRQNVTEWCHEFSKGRTDIYEEQRSGRPSLISDDCLQKI